MRKDHYVVNFPIVRFPGGGGEREKSVYQWGEVSYIVFFPTPEKKISGGKF